ncbi:hypothetical protein TNCV_365031 [Trichonephila clavipes]|nr:hypothetical protein TNCV_365031 [Trichonephila clavipes]
MELADANAITSGSPPTPPLPESICTHIRKLQKLVGFADSRFCFQQELIEIEITDRRDTDPAHLEALIREKGSVEQEYGKRLVELKGFFLAQYLITLIISQTVLTQLKMTTKNAWLTPAYSLRP